MAKVFINGFAYAWSDVTVNIAGTPVTGISAVTYEDKQEMENFYGAGNRPVARGFGKIECSGSVTLFADEVERIMKTVGNGRLQEIEEFDIVVSYLPPHGEVATHTLKNCRFKGNKRDVKVGGKNVEVQCDLLVSEILWK